MGTHAETLHSMIDRAERSGRLEPHEAASRHFWVYAYFQARTFRRSARAAPGSRRARMSGVLAGLRFEVSLGTRASG